MDSTTAALQGLAALVGAGLRGTEMAMLARIDPSELYRRGQRFRTTYYNSNPDLKSNLWIDLLGSPLGLHRRAVRILERSFPCSLTEDARGHPIILVYIPGSLTHETIHFVCESLIEVDSPLRGFTVHVAAHYLNNNGTKKNFVVAEYEFEEVTKARLIVGFTPNYHYSRNQFPLVLTGFCEYARDWWPDTTSNLVVPYYHRTATMSVNTHPVI